MVRYIIILGCLISLISGCYLKEKLPVTDEETASCRRIQVAVGPEDFVLDTWHKSPRLLISSHDRRHPEKTGGIYYFDIDSEKTGEMPRIGDPEKIKVFKPQGMDIRQAGKETLLYVIIHDPYGKMRREENAVIIYSVGDNKLTFVKLLEDPRHLWSPNDLSVLQSGEIYLTNDYRGSFDLYFHRKVSESAYYNPMTDVWSKAADQIAFANGILAEADRVFVTATLDDAVLEYPRNPDGTLGQGKIIADIKGPDNLTKNGNYLLVAAHFNDIAFMRHGKDPSVHSPSVVFRVYPEQLSKTAVFVDNGDLISAASTAMVYENKLFISDVFDPYMVICKIPKYLYR